MTFFGISAKAPLIADASLEPKQELLSLTRLQVNDVPIPLCGFECQTAALESAMPAAFTRAQIHGTSRCAVAGTDNHDTILHISEPDQLLLRIPLPASNACARARRL